MGANRAMVKFAGFPVGARVLIDGVQMARVKAFFPEGSTSYAFAHYKVDILGGAENVAVPFNRVGITPKEKKEKR